MEVTLNFDTNRGTIINYVVTGDLTRRVTVPESINNYQTLRNITNKNVANLNTKRNVSRQFHINCVSKRDIVNSNEIEGSTFREILTKLITSSDSYRNINNNQSIEFISNRNVERNQIRRLDSLRDIIHSSIPMYDLKRSIYKEVQYSNDLSRKNFKYFDNFIHDTLRNIGVDFTSELYLSKRNVGISEILDTLDTVRIIVADFKNILPMDTVRKIHKEYSHLFLSERDIIYILKFLYDTRRMRHDDTVEKPEYPDIDTEFFYDPEVFKKLQDINRLVEDYKKALEEFDVLAFNILDQRVNDIELLKEALILKLLIDYSD